MSTAPEDSNKEEAVVLPSLTHEDIALLFEPYAGHEEDDPPFTPNQATFPEGLVPAAVEYLGLHGYIIAPLYAKPAPSLCAHAACAALDAVCSLKFQEQADASAWHIIAGGSDIHQSVSFAFANAEMDALLARDGVPLFGRPTPEEFAAQHSPEDAQSDTPPSPPVPEDAPPAQAIEAFASSLS